MQHWLAFIWLGCEIQTFVAAGALICPAATTCMLATHIVGISGHTRIERVIGARLKVNQRKFFIQLGERVRSLRNKCGYSQEDMIAFGFSPRHWQQIESGRPITVSTLLRICGLFKVSAERLVSGLDRDIYED